MMPVGTELTAVGELSMAVEHPSEFRVGVGWEAVHGGEGGRHRGGREERRG